MKISNFGRKTPANGVSVLKRGGASAVAKKAQSPECADRIRWRVLECEILNGEHIVVIPDKKDGKDAAKKFYGLVRYYGAEIEELCSVEAASILAGKPREEMDAFLRQVHKIKKEFGAWVVPGSGGMTTVATSQEAK